MAASAGLLLRRVCQISSKTTNTPKGVKKLHDTKYEIALQFSRKSAPTRQRLVI